MAVGAEAETGVPQFWQKALPAARRLPHFEQYMKAPVAFWMAQLLAGILPQVAREL